MAENSGFFDSHLVGGKYDRTYLADDFARFFASFIGNGVYGGKSNELMVEQKTTANMSVSVLSGQAFINGYFYENTEPLSLSIEVADGVLNRIDLIVLRWDNVERVIRLAVKKGTPKTNAVAPSIQRDADFYELKLAEVHVKAGTTSIIQADITDTRLDSQTCGFVTGIIEQFDTTEFGKQLNSFIKKFEAENTLRMEEVLARLAEMAGDNDVARLVIDIENLKNADKNIKSDAAIKSQTLGFEKKNMIPYPFAINGIGVSGYIETGGIGLKANGVIWTDNGDGTLEANGTATADSYFTLYQGKMFEPGKYLITSGYSSTPTVYVYLRRVSKETGERVGDVYRSYEDNVVIEITEEDVELYDVIVNAIVVKDTTVGKVVLKPMIRRIEIDDDTWVPYEKSVKERLDEFAIEDPDEPGCYYRINKQTGMKEWVNPPLRAGWYYPLTERWNNKPVFQMTVYAASLPNNSAMVIQAPAEWNQIVSISGFAYDKDDLTYYPFPIILSGQITPLAVISRVEGDGSLVITTNGDASRFEAEIIIKYTRE